jgi:hypothetical protein
MLKLSLIPFPQPSPGALQERRKLKRPSPKTYAVFQIPEKSKGQIQLANIGGVSPA